MRRVLNIPAQSSRNAVHKSAAYLLIAAAMAGCANLPDGPLLDFAVQTDAPRWPAPPERARYALVAELTGAQDFATAKSRFRTGAGRFLRAIAGLAIGRRRPPELRRPVAGFTAEDGSIYVADMSLHAVAKFDLATSKFELWREPAKKETFAAPAAVIGDGAGGVYVSDAERAEIYHLSGEGEALGRFGGGVLDRPIGLARDPSDGAIFVADSGDHKVKKFSPDGEFLSFIGAPGEIEGAFNTPTHLFFDDGLLYVTDTFNFRVQQFNRNGDGMASFGANGIAVGSMARPKGVAVGQGGRIYVVESLYDRLLVFSSDGRFLMALAGEGRTAPKFYLPAGVWTDAEGRVYVADMFNGRIVIYQELTDMTEGRADAAPL